MQILTKIIPTREDVPNKSYCSFGFCPNYLPPFPQFGQLVSPTLVTLIKYSGFQDFEAVQSPAIVMLLHGWRQTVPGKKVTFFCFSNYMKFLSILTGGRGHIYRDPLRSQQGPRLRRLRRSLLLRRPQSGICGKDKSI